MNHRSSNILRNIIQKTFDYFIKYGPVDDIDKIHEIKAKEFDTEGYFLIICTQTSHEELDTRMIEIWKVYKTAKYYHVLEFDQSFASTPNHLIFYLYSYFDYRIDDKEDTLWRLNIPIMCIKLPDEFSL